MGPYCQKFVAVHGWWWYWMLSLRTATLNLQVTKSSYWMSVISLYSVKVFISSVDFVKFRRMALVGEGRGCIWWVSGLFSKSQQRLTVERLLLWDLNPDLEVCSMFCLLCYLLTGRVEQINIPYLQDNQEGSEQFVQPHHCSHPRRKADWRHPSETSHKHRYKLDWN